MSMRYRTQSIAYWYFALAVCLYGLQMVFGLLAAAKYLGPDPLIDLLPFDRVKAVHTNLLLVWVLTGFMGATYYVVPEESRAEIYSPKLAYAQLTLWGLGGVTAVLQRRSCVCYQGFAPGAGSPDLLLTCSVRRSCASR